MGGIRIRKARESDSLQFLSLLNALAVFEKLDPPDSQAERRILADIFTKRRLGLFVAEQEGKLVGYGLYFFSYSSFLAKPTLYLEDIFVLKSKRGRGIGSQLFRKCVREAVLTDCGRMEWAVLTWNKNAIAFYEKIGARRLKEWRYYRLDREKLNQLEVNGK
jgi:GNAT superfamily N-acetyltransferase